MSDAAVLVILHGDGRVDVFKQGDVRVKLESCGRGCKDHWWRKWLSRFWWGVMELDDVESEWVDERTVKERTDAAVAWMVPEIVTLVTEKVK